MNYRPYISNLSDLGLDHLLQILFSVWNKYLISASKCTKYPQNSTNISMHSPFTSPYFILPIIISWKRTSFSSKKWQTFSPSKLLPQITKYKLAPTFMLKLFYSLSLPYIPLKEHTTSYYTSAHMTWRSLSLSLSLLFSFSTSTQYTPLLFPPPCAFQNR